MKNGKILATGEGGFILTDDDELAKRCKLLRNHCTNIQDTSKSFSEIAWNYRITEMQALLGLYNLKDLKNKIKLRKNQTLYIYEQLKKNKKIKIYDYYSKEKSNYFSPVFLCKNGKKIAEELNKEGILNSTGTFGLIPANERKVIQDYCRKLDYYNGITIQNSGKLLKRIVAISLTENTKKDELDKIINKIKQIVEEVN